MQMAVQMYLQRTKLKFLIFYFAANIRLTVYNKLILINMNRLLELSIANYSKFPNRASSVDNTSWQRCTALVVSLVPVACFAQVSLL